MNIFDGFESTKAVEAARAKRMAAELFISIIKTGCKQRLKTCFGLESTKQRVGSAKSKR